MICFRPQQGLTIMNTNMTRKEMDQLNGFRPQQGLTIMNNYYLFKYKSCFNIKVSVPNRG